MFTGIIEMLGSIKKVQQINDTINLCVESSLAAELKIDQSVAHNGICLTVTACHTNTFEVCAVQETIDKTTISNWQVGDKINLERGIVVGDRLDGHLVQGHVDTVGKCIKKNETDGNRVFTFLYDASFAALMIEKGSVVINGVSLTCFNLTQNTFEVTIIPYTFAHTTFQYLEVGDAVNLEFDIIGKYFQRHISIQGK